MRSSTPAPGSMTSENHDNPNPFAALWDGVFDEGSVDLPSFGKKSRSFIARAAVEIEQQALRSAQEELSALAARDLRESAQNSQHVRVDRFETTVAYWYQTRIVDAIGKVPSTLEDLQIFDGKWVWQAKEAYMRAVLRGLRLLWESFLQLERRRVSQQEGPHHDLFPDLAKRLTKIVLDVEIADRPTAVGVRRRCIHSLVFL